MKFEAGLEWQTKPPRVVGNEQSYCIWEARVAHAVSALCLSPLKPSLVSEFSCERVPAVDLSCASRVFLRVLRFSTLFKINTL